MMRCSFSKPTVSQVMYVMFALLALGGLVWMCISLSGVVSSVEANGMDFSQIADNEFDALTTSNFISGSMMLLGNAGLLVHTLTKRKKDTTNKDRDDLHYYWLVIVGAFATMMLAHFGQKSSLSVIFISVCGIVTAFFTVWLSIRECRVAMPSKDAELAAMQKANPTNQAKSLAEKEMLAQAYYNKGMEDATRKLQQDAIKNGKPIVQRLLDETNRLKKDKKNLKKQLLEESQRAQSLPSPPSFTPRGEGQPELSRTQSRAEGQTEGQPDHTIYETNAPSLHPNTGFKSQFIQRLNLAPITTSTRGNGI